MNQLTRSAICLSVFALAWLLTGCAGRCCKQAAPPSQEGAYLLVRATRLAAEETALESGAADEAAADARPQVLIECTIVRPQDGTHLPALLEGVPLDGAPGAWLTTRAPDDLRATGTPVEVFHAPSIVTQVGDEARVEVSESAGPGGLARRFALVFEVATSDDATRLQLEYTAWRGGLRLRHIPPIRLDLPREHSALVAIR